MAFWEWDFMNMDGLDIHFTRTEYLKQSGLHYPPFGVSSASCPPNYEPMQKLLGFRD